MTDQRPLHERVLNIAVFAPVGLLRRLRDDLPGVVASGRREVEDRVRVARWVGEMSVTYGRAELKRKLAASNARGVTEVIEAETKATPPFEGYDELPADRLVQLLAKLPASELAMIRLYEQSQRARRTVLAKIDQLIDA